MDKYVTKLPGNLGMPAKLGLGLHCMAIDAMFVWTEISCAFNGTETAGILRSVEHISYHII